MRKQYIIGIISFLIVAIFSIVTFNYYRYSVGFETIYIDKFGYEDYKTMQNYFTKKNEALKKNDLQSVISIDKSLNEAQKKVRTQFILFDEEVNSKQQKESPVFYFIYKKLH